MDDGGSQAAPGADVRNATINVNDTILFKLLNGDVRSVKIENNSLISLGRVGSFAANDLIGHPYGLTYEIVNKKLNVVPPRTLQEFEDTDATNELINDGEPVQPLTADEIEALKHSGVHASDIIKKQIEQHAHYSLKTEYSKEKYKKRKEAKYDGHLSRYAKVFSTVEPTTFNVCEYWFNKDQNRIRDIRSDTLSQILSMSNLKPGGRYIAVDDASGLLVAAILERLGGEGRLVTICDTDSPPAYPVMTQMNFTDRATSVMSSLNWATVDEDYVPVQAAELIPEESKSDRQKARHRKRQAVSESLTTVREELYAGEFDGLIVASAYEPFEIVEKLFSYLGGSATIVVHSPHIQILLDLQNEMHSRPRYLAPTITEAWLRRYQVLPGRTHPTMNTSGSGGFLLRAFKVFDDPGAVEKQPKKRLKTSDKDVVEGIAVDASSVTETNNVIHTSSVVAAKEEQPVQEEVPEFSIDIAVDADQADCIMSTSGGEGTIL